MLVASIFLHLYFLIFFLCYISNIATEDMLYTESDLEKSMDKIETVNFHEVQLTRPKKTPRKHKRKEKSNHDICLQCQICEHHSARTPKLGGPACFHREFKNSNQIQMTENA